MRKHLNKKVKGISDLLASIIAILALTVFAFAYILFTGDAYTKIEISQTARKYISRMETQGTLTAEDRAALESELKNIDAVKAAVDDGNTIVIRWNSGSVADGTTVGYGNSLSLHLEVPAMTTDYSADNPTTGGQTTFGSIKRDKVRVYVINKSTTAKY